MPVRTGFTRNLQPVKSFGTSFTKGCDFPHLPLRIFTKVVFTMVFFARALTSGAVCGSAIYGSAIYSNATYDRNYSVAPASVSSAIALCARNDFFA